MYSDDEINEGTRLGVGVWIGIIFVFITAILTIYLAYAGGFATRPARLNNAQRQEAMSARMNRAWEGLKASEITVDQARKKVATYEELYGKDTATWPQGKRAEYQQDQQNYTNSVTAYNRACAEYNAVYADEYNAIAAPDDLPTRCALMNP